MESQVTYYDELGVPEDATSEQIRTAFHHKVKEYHPDLFRNSPDWVTREAEETTKRLNQAYSVLNDHRKRRRYDDEIRIFRERATRRGKGESHHKKGDKRPSHEAEATLRRETAEKHLRQEIEKLLRKMVWRRRLVWWSGAIAASIAIAVVVIPVLRLAPPKAPPLAIAENKVINGDFETPDAGPRFVRYQSNRTFAGWIVEGSSIDHKGLLWQAASGRQSVDLDGSEAGTIYQDVPTSPGQSYLLRFAMAGNPDSGPSTKEMEVWWGGQLLDTLTFSINGRTRQNMGWRYYEYKVTSSADHTRLRFSSLSGGGWGPTVDDVSLRPLTFSSSD